MSARSPAKQVAAPRGEKSLSMPFSPLGVIGTCADKNSGRCRLYARGTLLPTGKQSFGVFPNPVRWGPREPHTVSDFAGPVEEWRAFDSRLSRERRWPTFHGNRFLRSPPWMANPRMLPYLAMVRRHRQGEGAGARNPLGDAGVTRPGKEGGQGGDKAPSRKKCKKVQKKT